MSTASKDSQVSLRLPSELKSRVETYAQLTGRSKSHVAMEALKEYLVWREPQIADLKEAIAAADHGEFASDQEVEDTFARYSAAAPSPKRSNSAGKRGARQK
ncbi:CopG family ribbon-helix-helix protein [Piscinibacter terrae]|uniref:CopG family transcriptional regulator n=1 Tax=Piscinibacter terrae TaxID=2496871 RepID=A0A3N7K0L8_9BURK|nr:CopG family transcriptional regulator [Albitalea terrae]RQP24555.1 CopG family transcriptional regulator [Albitalea terrae]